MSESSVSMEPGVWQAKQSEARYLQNFRPHLFFLRLGLVRGD